MKCFLAANSAEGFVSEFGSCYDPTKDWRAYIIKGGPGTGKSSFMRKVLKRTKISDNTAVEVYCASDPDSLDAVILPSSKTVIMDGTAPHIVEPKMPGIGDSILNFGNFWDETRLKKFADRIISSTRENKALHGMAGHYIRAAGEIISACFEQSEKIADRRRAEKRYKEIADSYIPKKGGSGYSHSAFICGVTPKGIISFEEELSAENRIEIGDGFGAESEQITKGLAATATERGYETVVFRNPILPSTLTDGVFIPELSLFVYKKHKLADDSIVTELLNHASEYIKKAKEIHDELEGYYISAMDFEALNKYTDRFLSDRF